MDTSIPPQKQCTKCEQFFPATLEYFPPRKNTKDGLRNDCRECNSQTRHAHYKANDTQLCALAKDHYKAHQQENCIVQKHYREGHKTEKNAYNKAYQKTHKAELRTHKQENYRARITEIRAYNAAHIERKRAWNEAHATEIHAYHINYRKAHPEQQTAHNHKRRIQKQAIECTLTAEQIHTKLLHQKYRCYYCHAKFKKKNERYIYHLEHTVPISRTEMQPRHDVNYVVLACPTCNLRKGAKLPHEWPEGGRLL